MARATFPDSDNYGKLSDLRNHETHWFTCYVCGGVSWDSDTAALAGLESLAPANVMHHTNCPGRVFPDKHVRRIQRTY